MAYFRCGGGGMPAGLQSGMDAVLNKKFGTSTTYPASDWPDTVNLMGVLPEKTVSGAIAVIDDGADDVPTKSLIVTIPASLSGVSSVTEKQTGRNLFDKDNANVVDGYIDVSAFNTGNANAKTIYIPIKGGVTYTVSKTVGARFSIATSEVIPTSGATYTSRQAGNTSASLTITAGANDAYLWAWIYLNGTDTGTLEDMLASVQIEYGSTAHAYEPYQTPTGYTASLGRTIYGGQVDIVNGEGQETYQHYTASDVTSLYWNNKKAQQVDTNHNATFRIATTANYLTTTNPLSNMLTHSYNITTGNGDTVGFQVLPAGGIYICVPLSLIGLSEATSSTDDSVFLDAIHNLGSSLEFVVNLATPTDFTFTGQEVPTRLGYNAFWSDEGDTEVTYRRDIDLALGGN